MSLMDKVPVKKPPPQYNCWPAGGVVKCVWSLITDSNLKHQVNSSWDKELYVMRTFGSPDDSLNVCGDEKMHFSFPRISRK